MNFRDRIEIFFMDASDFVRDNKKGVFIGAACVLAVAAGSVFTVNAALRRQAYNAADSQMAKAEALSADMVSASEGEALSDEELADAYAAIDAEASEKKEYADGDSTFGDMDKEALGKKEHLSNEYMRERIDFGKLHDLIASDDVWGWIVMPDTPIDYIVMQGDEEDQSRYLWKDAYGDDSRTGSLYVHADSSGVDDHTVIYGHRLKDHDLYFGPLLNFRDGSFADSHKDVYTYDRGRVTHWELAYACEGQYDDAVYYYPYTRNTDEWDALASELSDKSFWRGTDFHEDDHMLVLSTCSGPGAGRPERLYLVYRDRCWWDYQNE